jgi:hypothetical protein
MKGSTMSTTPQKPTVGRIILVPVQTRRRYGDGEGPKDATIEIRPAIAWTSSKPSATGKSRSALRRRTKSSVAHD